MHEIRVMQFVWKVNGFAPVEHCNTKITSDFTVYLLTCSCVIVVIFMSTIVIRSELRKILQAQVPGAELVVAEIGPKRLGDAFQNEDYTGSDLTIFAVDPRTKQPVPGADLHK